MSGPAQAIGDIALETLLGFSADCPADQKERILIAYEEGAISPAMTDWLIAVQGLEAE